MRSSVNWWLEKVIIILLYFSIVTMLLATGVSRIFSHNIQIFLILSILFSISMFIFLLYNKKLLISIIKGFWLFNFAVVLTIISTIKYLFSLAENQGITFFTVYQIVIFAFFGFLVYVFLAEKKEYLPKVSILLCTTESIMILCFQNTFMLDLGLYRFMGIYDNPNIQGLFAVISSILSLYVITANYGFKIISLFNFSLAVAAIILSLSRTSLLALIVGLFVFCIFNIKHISKNHSEKIIGRIIIGIFLIIFFTYLFTPNDSDMKQAVVIGKTSVQKTQKSSAKKSESTPKKDVRTAISSRLSLSSESKSSIRHNLRFSIWEGYLKNISDYYLIGTDYTLNNRPIVENAARDSHNTIIYTFFRYGIIALISLLLLLTIIGIKFFCKKGKTSYQIASLSCFCSICIISLLNDLLNTPIYFFILGFVYVSMQDSRKRVLSINEPYRILQIFSSLNKGGAESRTMDIYRKLEKKNFNLILP